MWKAEGNVTINTLGMWLQLYNKSKYRSIPFLEDCFLLKSTCHVVLMENRHNCNMCNVFGHICKIA